MLRLMSVRRTSTIALLLIKQETALKMNFEEKIGVSVETKVIEKSNFKNITYVDNDNILISYDVRM